ncbi:hypothetical protein SPRG_19287 [Saprolegnia parasitica CBS 223.65]|uniref:Uncharacterized protein n=1 Tax=Saprolegnia parasitica (strain CBS 223.65) TaxID=695850 RepID=A0A067D3W0_SAPPC|nr:hypothetical protein SPRG_19287 [Saprolegnia parasitica CBS 223.65]KDO33677.1 hypothetical protein SPRG_19287 [Saprolegnia parasitica CBS 223.65]|eukprot:XP_012195704.1 hypothetical protein SPRG_19287 [Saprolegnia parasitica CBS 223.65]
METLTRKPRAGPVAVATNASLSLSFKLPAAFAASLAQSAPAPARDAWESDEDESWETKVDVLLQVAPIEDTTMGAWQDDLEAFPDAFPLLLVNLSRLSLEHMGAPLATNDDAARVSASIQDVFDSSKFSYVIETLFEQEIAIHTTYGACKSYLAYLHGQSKDVWATVDYPARVDDEVPLSELLAVIERPTQWASVNHIKEYMAKTSRDIKWKAQVLEELEYLAAFEQDVKDAADAQLRLDIQNLSGLRDSLLQKLAVPGKKNAMSRRLDKMQLESVETQLAPLLETFLAPPAPPAKFSDAATYTKAGLDSGNTGVLDMILSMVFSRLPQPPALALDAHFTSLVQSHEHVRHLWLQDFGRLPPRTTVDDDGDVVEVEAPNIEHMVREEDVAPVGVEPPTRDMAEDDEDIENEAPIDAGNESDAYKGDADDDENDSEAEAAAARKRQKSKQKKAKKKVKKAKEMADFTPFACVRGLALLKLSEDEQQLYG